MLRIDNRDASELQTVSLEDRGHSEDDLREWLIYHPASFLGEEILVIGREVRIEGINDGIDILAIDKAGCLVVIELKRGALRGDVDFQGLKYASYVSRWGYEDVREQFDRFLTTDWGTRLYAEEADFTEMVEEFCDDDFELNSSQRLIFVGETVRERIGSVVLWLREQGIDASIVTYKLFSDGDDRLYIDAGIVVPPPTDTEQFEIGRNKSDKPWKSDGYRWHLKERTGKETAELVGRLIDRLAETDLTGPHWNQKFYIAFRANGTNRVQLRTRKQSVMFELFDIPFDDLNGDQVAADLGIDSEIVRFERIGSDRPRIRIKCNPDDDLDIDVLLRLVGR